MLKLRKSKTQKGITLIALIITIVVLLILAAVAISSITNDGILSYAQNAAKDYNQAVKNEQSALDGYLEFLEGSVKIVDEDGNDLRNKTVEENTEVYDKYGNKIVVPAGFKIRVDETTNNADTVTEGLVIEDGTNGNQFVWIPVGKIYTDTAKTESLAKTITLGRYVFATGTKDYDGDGTNETAGEIVTSLSKTNPSDELKTSSTSSYNYTEGLKNSTTANAHARDIEAFITSANTKGGYYLGRYEARTNNTTGRAAKTDELTAMTSIQTNAVYNYVTQAQASSLAQGMYADGYSSGTFSSDLINSYAWDTAIVFLQTFDNRADKTTPYSRQNSLNSSLSLTGTTTDVICNIYDMASNCYEWSTEAFSDTFDRCVSRGGYYFYSTGYTSYRNGSRTSTADNDYAFRPLLYVGL